MKKLLVAYDNSEHSEKALDQAIQLAGGSERELIVLFVRSKFDRNFLNSTDTDESEVKTKLKDMMKEAVKKVIIEGIKVEGVILKGDVADKIMDYSNEHDIDIIIIGALGIGSSGKYNLGSVAEKLVRYSEKPVLIVK